METIKYNKNPSLTLWSISKCHYPNFLTSISFLFFLFFIFSIFSVFFEKSRVKIEVTDNFKGRSASELALVRQLPASTNTSQTISTTLFFFTSCHKIQTQGLFFFFFFYLCFSFCEEMSVFFSLILAFFVFMTSLRVSATKKKRSFLIKTGKKRVTANFNI